MAKKTTTESGPIEIRPLQRAQTTMLLLGTSSLVMNRMAKKAR